MAYKTNKKQGYESPDSILLATVDVNYKLSIYKQGVEDEKKNVLE